MISPYCYNIPSITGNAEVTSNLACIMTSQQGEPKTHEEPENSSENHLKLVTLKNLHSFLSLCSTEECEGHTAFKQVPKYYALWKINQCWLFVHQKKMD